MTFRNFEEFLQFKHSEDYHGLDDEMPDAFNDWLGQLEGEEYINFADEYNKFQIEKLIEDFPQEEMPIYGLAELKQLLREKWLGKETNV